MPFPNQNIELFEYFLSPERLGAYIRMADGRPDNAVALYLCNLDHCQRFYKKLHWLEIGLRNAINRQLSIHYGSMWFDSRNIALGAIEKQQIKKAKDTLLKNNKPITNANIVAALNFGLWVNLFNSPYENLWRFNLRKSFPGCRTTLQRKELRAKLHPVLGLRNRIAHYEPIIYLDLAKLNQDIEDIISWIEIKILPTMQEMQ